MQVHSFNPHVEFKCGRNIEKNTWSKYYSTVLWSTALLLSEFYFHRSRLQVLLPMDTHTSSRRALKLAQEQEVQSLKSGDGPEMRERTCCRDFGTKERKSKGREVVLGTLLKLIVKDKLLHSGKVPVNAELRPLRREKRRTEVQQYGSLNEAMKI